MTNIDGHFISGMWFGKFGWQCYASHF
jgi:hypothetical protein